MSEQARDNGLIAHRVITYIVGITSTITAAVLLSFIQDVGAAKIQLVRLEPLPAKIDAILTKVEETNKDVQGVKETTTNLDWRLKAIENNPKRTR
jgi:low affinity Fe/Cu permease